MLHRLPVVALLLLTAAKAQFIPDVVTYTDATHATHQAQWTTLSGQGYRPISLSVAGGWSSARYTAVWIRRSGANYTGTHGATVAAYDTWSTQQRNAGYRPLLVTTAGATGDEVYAGVWVNDGVAAEQHTELFTSSMTSTNTWAYNNDYVLTCASVRGSGSSLRFAGVWEENVNDDGWCFYVSTAAGYSVDFNARTDGFGRTVSAQTMPNGSVAQVWRDDSIGGWETLPGLTSAQLQSEITTRRPSGQYPTSIQATGTGSAARFHVVFAFRDRPLTRVVTRTGLAVIPMAGFDTYMEDHIRAHGIRASSIAIAKDGRLVFARGYTFAESGYRVTQPTSLFRIASLSKTLTGLCTNLLIQRGTTITANTLIGSYLGLSPLDARFNQIRVHHLLAHRAGVYSDNSSYGVATWLNASNPTLPVTAWQTTLAAAGSSLANTPGLFYDYSNIGYYLLGSVIERASSKTYERFLQEDVAAPMGVSRIWVGANERAQLRAEEVEYRNRELEITPSELYTDRRIVPVQFGGGGDDNLRRRAAAGGIVTSTVDYVRIFSGAMDLACDGGVFTANTVNTMRSAPPTAPGANPCGFDTRQVRDNGVVALGKNGGLWGSSTEFIHRTDGVSIAVFDGRANSNANREALNDLADAVTNWPSHDLFPSYGLPAFARRCPRVHNVQNPTVPSVSDTPVVIEGDVLSGVDRVTFGARTITSRLSTSWADGWFEIVDDNRIDLHVPQGLTIGSHSVRLYNGIYASAPFDVWLARQPASFLGGPSTSFVDFEMVAARGPASISSVVLLCISNSTVPSVAQGIVSLGIGNRFAELLMWPVTVPINTLTGCARWTVPGSVAGLWQFQGAILDPNAANPLPLSVTNVRAVRVF